MYLLYPNTFTNYCAKNKKISKYFRFQIGKCLVNNNIGKYLHKLVRRYNIEISNEIIITNDLEH